MYGENAQQPIVATVMEEMDNFTCVPPSGKLIGECGVVLNNGFPFQPFWTFIFVLNFTILHCPSLRLINKSRFDILVLLYNIAGSMSKYT